MSILPPPSLPTPSDVPAGTSTDPRSFLDYLGENLVPGEHLLPAATLAQIADTYDFTLRARGMRAESVLWRSRFSQWQRFRLLLQIITRQDRRDRGLVINDFGCGYGALYRMLRRKGYMQGGAYFGYDLCPAMVRSARLSIAPARRSQPKATFIDSDRVTQMADYTLCSGTFGLRMDTPPEVWRRYVQETLLHLAQYSRRGLAFNLLSAEDPAPKETLYYADPEDFRAFCHDKISPQVTLIEGAFRSLDFTIHVRL
jgi:SAM-dependent methyltransferase